MHNILLEIIEKKKQDLFTTPPNIALEKFKKSLFKKSGKNKFKEAIISAKDIAIIGEIKFASPTHPNLGTPHDLLKRAKLYEKSGIDAISLITEQHYFKGDIAFVAQVKKNVKAPVLQKDFIIDASQIYQAKQAGSDALLLIARLLDKEVLKIFVSLCQRLDMEPVVEINNDEDLAKAIETPTAIIAVNARNLETFAIDIIAACLLLKKISKKFITLGFSGITSLHEVLQYKNAGAQGVLVGTSLMKAKNVSEFIKSLRVTAVGGLPIARTEMTIERARREGTAGRTHHMPQVKICGIRDLKIAQEAIAAGADFLGFNFVPTSKRYIDSKKAKKIIAELRVRNQDLGIKFVGVFQNQSIDEVNKIADMLDLDFVQLHGNEDVDYRKKMQRKIIQRIHTDGSFTDKENCEYFLLDREIQGQGKMIDLSLAQELAKHFPVFIAGGLTPENVGDVIKTVNPFGVDVAGGIETDGKQDAKKIKLFIKNAKEAAV